LEESKVDDWSKLELTWVEPEFSCDDEATAVWTAPAISG